jgi:hypothetical protein
MVRDVNTWIAIIIVVGFLMLGYTHIEHLTNEVTYVKSSIDGEEYLVRNAPQKEKAADILCRVRTRLMNLTEHMYNKYGKKGEEDGYQNEDDDENDENRVRDQTHVSYASQRLKKKFNPDNISESGASNKYTSYSVNKGEKIIFCLRQKNEEQSFVDENTITFVAIHELAHIMTLSIGHEPEFWNNFKILLREAVDLGLYKKEDYSKNPKPYCGITVTDNPLFG